MFKFQSVDGSYIGYFSNDFCQPKKSSHSPQCVSPLENPGPSANKAPERFPGDPGETMLWYLPGSGFLLFSSGRSSEALNQY